MIRNRSNRRGALVWSAVFFLAALLVWAMSFQLRSGALRGAFVGTELEAQMILVAESAADEVVLAAARAANAAGDLAAATARRDTPLTAALIARLDTGAAKLRVAGCTAALDTEKNAPPGEVRAVLTVTAKVEGRSGRLAATRTVTRRHGLRLSTMGAPMTFSETALYIDDGGPIIAEVEAMIETVDAVLSARLKDLAPAIEAAEGDIADDQIARRDALRSWVDARRARPSPKRLALLVSPRTASVPDLGALIPRRKWTAAREAAAEANTALVTASAANDPDGTIDGVDQVLIACEELRTLVDATSTAWIELAHGSDIYRALSGPLAEARTRWAERAWFELASLSELAGLLGNNAAARNGIVSLRGPVDLDGRAIWAGAKGRLVLVVRGAARLHDLVTPEGASLTVVAEGPIEVAGRVDAHVVALAGLTVAPGARLRGHLTVLGGAVQLGDFASIERGAVAAPAVHAALDPFAAPSTVD